MSSQRDGLVWHDADLPDGLALDILDHVPDPIFVKDREYRFVILNRALEQMLGRPRGEMFGKTDFDFFSKGEAEFFRQKDEEMFRTGESVRIDDEPITDAAGNRHHLATTKAPLRSSNNEITHLVGIIHDITPLKQAQAALEQSNEQLEAKVQERTEALRAAQEELIRKERLALLGRLAGGLAHQIRNPLGAILNSVALLKRAIGDTPSESVRDALRVLEEESWGANRIITDLIDFMRVRKGTPEVVGLRNLVRRVVELQLESDAIEFVARVPEVTVYVDIIQTTSALTNLVRNAVEAMNGEGRLTFEAVVDGGETVLLIEDSGPGVCPTVEQRLFEPLLTTKPLGLGLGLSTARMLIEAQGGTLRLSRARPGAVFEVRLPASESGIGRTEAP